MLTKRLHRTEAGVRQGEEGLLRPAEAARFLGYSERGLQNWRLKGVGPRFLRLNPRSVRYRLRDLEEWLAARETRPGA